MEKSKIGGILSIVGGSLLIFALIWFQVTQNNVIQMLQLIAQGGSIHGNQPIITILGIILTLTFGLLGILGGILSLKGKMAGNIIAIIVGLIATLGMFVIFGPTVISLPPNYYFWPQLVYKIFYGEPIILLVGGILGLAIREK